MMVQDDGGYVFVNNRRLRTGYTTGTCAAAAAKAAAEAVLSGQPVVSVELLTPKGVSLDLDVEDLVFDSAKARCAIRKDGGDDIDATHGALVYAEVVLTEEGISIDGGEGVGRVTKKGLDQPVGSAAINRVPRSMIESSLKEIAAAHGYVGGFDVTITVPEGKAIAPKTFNPRLGIEGGISVLGTSGIVEPMSEAALVATIVTEMNVRAEQGDDVLLVVPGNYGKEFAEGLPGVDPESAVKCSNFVGEMLDRACILNKDVLLVGNLGKMVKLAGGIMNTHSRNADCRMEILAAAAIHAGADAETAADILGRTTTDDALEAIKEKGLLEKVSPILAERIDHHTEHRTGGQIKVGTIVFSSVYGLLFMTKDAPALLERVRRQCR